MAEIAIRLNKKRYLTKLNTHAQYIRWLRSTPCYCLDQAGNTDPACPSCLGRGRIFTHQTEFDVWVENSKHCDAKVYPTYVPIVRVDKVLRLSCWQKPYAITNVFSDHIEIATTPELPVLPDKDEFIGVNYTYSVEQDYLAGPAAFIGGDVLSVPLPATLTVEKESILGDITKVIGVARNVTKSKDYDVKTFYKNELYIDLTPGAPATSDVWQVTLKYKNPHKLMLNNISEKERRMGAYIASEGEASMTAPYEYYFGDGDVVIQLVGEQRGSAVLVQSPIDNPVNPNQVFSQELPAFDVTKVLTIEDGTGAVYQPGVDFIVRGGNQLFWLTSNRPVAKFSVTFLYHPAFTIFGTKPTVRTPENLKMPRRLMLKSFDKVNTNYDLHRVNEPVGT
jgi:hypothetical protein